MNIKIILFFLFLNSSTFGQIQQDLDKDGFVKKIRDSSEISQLNLKDAQELIKSELSSKDINKFISDYFYLIDLEFIESLDEKYKKKMKESIFFNDFSNRSYLKKLMEKFLRKDNDLNSIYTFAKSYSPSEEIKKFSLNYFLTSGDTVTITRYQDTLTKGLILKRYYKKSVLYRFEVGSYELSPNGKPTLFLRSFDCESKCFNLKK